MIHILAQILAIAFTLIGIAFMLIGSIGIVRLPDVYHRLHAASKCTTLGLLGLLLGAICHVISHPDGMPIVIKSILTIVFAFAALPTGSHILAKAAYKAKAPLWQGTLDDEIDPTPGDAPAPGSTPETPETPASSAGNTGPTRDVQGNHPGGELPGPATR